MRDQDNEPLLVVISNNVSPAESVLFRLPSDGSGTGATVGNISYDTFSGAESVSTTNYSTTSAGTSASAVSVTYTNGTEADTGTDYVDVSRTAI